MTEMWSLMDNNISHEDRDVLTDFIQTTERFTNGPKVVNFENEWSKWLGIDYSLMVNSGASGNYLTIALLKQLVGTGDVIVPALGWSSDVSSLIQLGFKPIFVDVNIENFGVNENDVISSITEKTVAVVVVHGLGFNALSKSLVDTLKKHKIIIIEDCCEAHGARIPDLSNQRAGTVGDLSVFSFYYGHHMTTVEGGMVCTNNEDYYESLRMFRSHGMTREASERTKQKFIVDYPNLNPDFTFAVPGFNFRSTEINAVLGLQQLPRLDRIIADRTRNLIDFLELLDDRLFVTNYDVEGSSNFALPICMRPDCKDRFGKVIKVLQHEHIEFRVGTAGGGNMSIQPFVINSNHSVVGPLDVANFLHHYALYIGNGSHVTLEMIQKLTEKLNNV